MKVNLRWKPKSFLGWYIVAFALGIIVGFKVVPLPAIAGVYFILIAVCLFHCIKGDVDSFFQWLPYPVYLEVFMRAFIKGVPYLTLQYLFIVGFPLLMFRGIKQRKPHFTGVFFIAFYCFFELINNVYPHNPAHTRAIITNSLALLAPVVWASYNNMKPVLINKLLNNIKIAGVFLAGNVAVAHITGGINYGLFSSSEASNGMAPVQLSGYLGTVCILLFLSIMNPDEIKNRLINVIMLGVVTVIMVLTFSRGGLYFLAILVLLFFYYNWKTMGRYVHFIVLLPIAMLLYNIAVDFTGGKIVERYEQEGTSNRDVLVSIGFTLFLKHPYLGVGTGNYNHQIVQEHLFDVESGAHNEFVRAAAEHGIVGIIFYWTFFVVLYLNIIRRPQPQRQYAMYFFVLFVLIIIHNGLKISIQPLLLMIAVGTPGFVQELKRNVYARRLHHAKLA